MNLPNKLTIFRLILIFPLLLLFIAYKYFIDYNYKISHIVILSLILLIFVIAMITDYFDGKIARKNNLITSFGKLWDPLADKIIVTSTMLFLTLYSFIPFWIVIVFIIRDLIVDGSRVVMAKKNIGVEASLWGKLKTLTQTIGIITILIIAISFNYPIEFEIKQYSVLYTEFLIHIINIPLIIGLGFSIFSGYLYVKKIIPHLELK
ncbi:CDP-diacylglycerol--glycerol-3-phosphate 3-phosphatidyltransferase [Mycoplasmopsis lipofaciens]|uniref:CDP-diacylglycerol--glycerol-3-phosphate 3-phosphatidyltransferase n=1 Tax=Mycoplasmopsis lipofaciens TaxID=114884 RepID=UPI0004850474|nr:CDP-diacylglycerol--glycerol-3-phosphate 3-phosphatidyltransferase [Mycoplasmopsis lipofaciens]